jgi:hypothetical protein
MGKNSNIIIGRHPLNAVLITKNVFVKIISLPWSHPIKVSKFYFSPVATHGHA